MRRWIFVFLVSAIVTVESARAQVDDSLGNLSANPYAPNSTSNPYGAGNPYDPNSIKNPYGRYGSPYSPNSVINPRATDTPELYDAQGRYRGKLSTNPYDPESISNPYGRYGNPYSPDSINNPYGAGSPYRPDSPTNPYGSGWTIEKPSHGAGRVLPLSPERAQGVPLRFDPPHRIDDGSNPIRGVPSLDPIDPLDLGGSVTGRGVWDADDGPRNDW